MISSANQQKTVSPDQLWELVETSLNEGQTDLKALQNALHTSCSKLAARSQLSPQKFVAIEDWRPVCESLETSGATSLNPKTFLSWLKTHFDISRETTTGKLTGYFQPRLKASRRQTDIYKYPVYKRPKDLILIEDLAVFTTRAKGIRIAGTLQGSTLIPYASRAEIDAGYLSHKNLEIAYIQDPVDLFFMHIQGSGQLIFESGDTITVSYDGTNGHDYTSIGQVMISEGLLPKENKGMCDIKRILNESPERGQSIMHQNASYVFFREQPKTTSETIGAQGIPITPLISVASDPHHYPLGSLLFIATEHNDVKNRLVLAQDVGGAIKGRDRLDLFCGYGDNGSAIAGNLKDAMVVLKLSPKSN